MSRENPSVERSVPIDVSIIIPIYNVAPYIATCLQSVIAQTYCGQLECILIDDCGQDDSISIAQKIIQDYQGTCYFNIIYHETNRGLSASRNSGIRAASGRYLYFLDSDDYLSPDCIASVMLLVSKYPNVEMVQGGCIVHGTKSNLCFDLQSSFLPEYVEGQSRVEWMMLNRKQFPITSWNRLISKDFLVQHNLFFFEGIIHEDELWHFQLAKHLKSLAILHQNIYNYVRRTESITSVLSSQRASSLVQIARQMIQETSSNGSSIAIEYIRHFIHHYSFDIQDETQRKSFLECSLDLSDKMPCFKRFLTRSWVRLAMQNIRKHYLLYTLLYHTA